MPTKKEENVYRSIQELYREAGTNLPIDFGYQLKKLDITDIKAIKPLSELSDDYIYLRKNVTKERVNELADSLIIDVSSKNTKHDYEIQVIEPLIIWETPEGDKRYVISGNTRRSALLHLHKKYKDDEKYKFLPITYKVFKSKETPNKFQLIKIQTLTNDKGAPHTTFELAQAVSSMHQSLTLKYGDKWYINENGKQRKFKVDKLLTEIFSMSSASISKYKSIATLDEFFVKKIGNNEEISAFTAEKLQRKCESFGLDFETTYNQINEVLGKVSSAKVDKFFDEIHSPITFSTSKVKEANDEYVKSLGENIEVENIEIERQEIDSIIEDANLEASNLEASIAEENALGYNENDTLTGINQENHESEIVPKKQALQIGKYQEEDTEIDKDLVSLFLDVGDNMRGINDSISQFPNPGIEVLNGVSEVAKEMLFFMAVTSDTISNKEELCLYAEILNLFTNRFLHSDLNKTFAAKLIAKFGKKRFDDMAEKVFFVQEKIRLNPQIESETVVKDDTFTTTNAEIK